MSFESVEMSCQPCGCDLGAAHLCERHRAEMIAQTNMHWTVQSTDVVTARELPPTGAIRTFATGATRNLDADKLDFEGFYHPSVMKAFAEYMHTNRIQADGSLRDSDNWQKGIPFDAYMKSGFRHFFEAWELHRARPLSVPEWKALKTALCALLFNVQGYLFELLKEDPSELKYPESKYAPDPRD